jgi:hypothetical protein
VRALASAVACSWFALGVCWVGGILNHPSAWVARTAAGAFGTATLTAVPCPGTDSKGVLAEYLNVSAADAFAGRLGMLARLLLFGTPAAGAAQVDKCG